MVTQQTPEPNTIMFTWINQYSGVLLQTQTKTLLVDPVEVKAKNYPKIDAILITHEHYDHLDQTIITDIQKATGCAVIADHASTKKLQAAIPPTKLVAIKAGQQTKLGAVTIKAQISNHHATSPNTYIITSEDGVKVYHTSDSLPFPEMGQMGQKEFFDIVFCTVGAAPGATAESGFEIAWLTKPGLAVPYHTGTPVNQTKFAELMKTKLRRSACLIPELNQTYQISKRQT
jgi:L-ascorbate metabolism protein UlaG (beta-lactamase superfamily)